MDDFQCLVRSHTGAGSQVSNPIAIGTKLTVRRTIAKHVAEAASPDKSILIDCFAGVGGNTIAFALSGRWKRVYGIEKDARALACAKHNAQIYEVEDQISWYEGDCFEILSNQLADLAPYSIVFASPPWGGQGHGLSCLLLLMTLGPTYRSNKIFDLNTMVPYSLDTLYKSFCNYSGNIVLYLPRTSDMRQLAKKGNATGPILVMHYCMEGASKVPKTTIQERVCNPY